MDDEQSSESLRMVRRVAPEKLQRSRELRRTMTPAERLLWEHLRAHRFANLHFRRQYVVAGFIVDFYCHAAGLVVEVDGRVHEATREYDAARDAVLRSRGLRVLRVTNDDVVRDIGYVLRRIGELAPSQPPPQGEEQQAPFPS